MIPLVAATFLLQWATGGMLFLWVTTRRREVGLGYGWLMRSVFACMLGLSLLSASTADSYGARDVACVLMLVVVLAALVTSLVRRAGGVAGQQLDHNRRSGRVATMTGIDREAATTTATGKEFPPVLDLVAGVIGLIGCALDGLAQSSALLAVVRNLSGALFLGCVSDAMLLGHWYLVQPGLPRASLNQLVRWLLILVPIEVVAMLLPTGMSSVLSGVIDDGYNGVLGYMWLGCAMGTGVLALVTRAALKERAYAAVMAATGLLYLAILTAFGTDLIARAVLAGTF